MNVRSARRARAACFVLAAAAICGPSGAANVSLTGAVANVCLLTVATPGTLGMGPNGTTLSSEETGGLNATVTVTATGSNPTISFSAPTLAGPSASTGSATKQIGYNSPAGANQGYTDGASTYTMNRLLDSVTVRGRATNLDGFVTGTYTIASTVTCQQ